MVSDFGKDWDWYAQLIEERKEAPEWETPRRVRESHWEELFDIRSGDRVLDAGCGHGDYTLRALQRGARLWSFDYSDGMVRCTRALLKRYRLEAEEVKRASVLEIPYPDASFDRAMCLAVIDHLPPEDRVTALRELKRVLVPGGKLYVDVPNRFAYQWRLGLQLMRIAKRYPKGKMHFFTTFELRRMVDEAGLTPSRSLGFSLMPPFSGIYTSDLRRLTVLPQPIISLLDRIYLALETRLRRVPPLKGVCFHYVLEATNGAARPRASRDETEPEISAAS